MDRLKNQNEMELSNLDAWNIAVGPLFMVDAVAWALSDWMVLDDNVVIGQWREPACVCRIGPRLLHRKPLSRPRAKMQRSSDRVCVCVRGVPQHASAWPPMFADLLADAARLVQPKNVCVCTCMCALCGTPAAHAARVICERRINWM